MTNSGQIQSALTAERLAVIDAAIAYLRDTPADVVKAALARTAIHTDLAADPAGLSDRLAECSKGVDSPTFYATFRAAAQIMAAAGQDDPAGPPDRTRTRQTTQPLNDLRLSMSGRAARELAHMVIDGYVTLDPPYQRGDVWTEDQRIALIKSWLEGIPVPGIIVNDRSRHGFVDGWSADEPMYAVIDGKQRLTTAIMWFTDELAVPASWFEAEDVQETVDTDDGPYVRYTGLSAARQRQIGILGFILPFTEAKVTSVAAEAAVYLQVNGGGTPQTAADMANAARVAGQE